VQVLRTQDDHDAQARNAIAECYISGTYSKVLEFLHFHRRGRCSLTYWDASTEAAMADARMATAEVVSAGSKLATAAAAVQAGVWTGLESIRGRERAQEASFNEDLAQLPLWYPPVSGPWCVLDSLKHSAVPLQTSRDHACSIHLLS
jgi:hypothetical protein